MRVTTCVIIVVTCVDIQARLSGKAQARAPLLAQWSRASAVYDRPAHPAAIENADFISPEDGLKPHGVGNLKHGLQLGISARSILAKSSSGKSISGKSISVRSNSAKLLAILLLPLALAACVTSNEDSGTLTYTADRGIANQPFPNNYRAETLAFMKTYLTNPVGVHDAAMAEPVQRTVGGRLRYVTCLHFTPRESDGSYRELRERAILYVDGRLDRMVEHATDICAGATYLEFPELEKLTR